MTRPGQESRYATHAGIGFQELERSAFTKYSNQPPDPHNNEPTPLRAVGH